ncbi:MAG: hypothetical protein KF799_08620 [Bdellovibrionales bacterium]|nr:hypothetical protein [Bdellovibrionales bacterium]
MRPMAVLGLCIVMAGSSLSCSVNVLETFADKNTDDAYFVDAQRLINDGEYDAALTKIALMSDDYSNKRQVVMLRASAYGGKCGFRFMSFVQELGDMGTTRLFPFLTSQFIGGTPARIDSCLAAEDLIESIGDTADRTTDENMFLVLVSFAKMGNVLSLYADSNQNGIPDTAADTGGADYNACTETPRATRPTTAVTGDWYTGDLRQFGSGLTLALANIAAVSGTVDLGDASLASITDACDDLAVLNPAYDFCSVTDPAAFTADQLKGIKSLLKEDSVVGLGTDCTGGITTCNCP